MEWIYAILENGRLIDNEFNVEININFPSFETEAEANAYIETEDLRISII